MSKEKLNSLSKYEQELKNKLASAVPPKHRTRAAPYVEFLERELKKTSKKIEELRLSK